MNTPIDPTKTRLLMDCKHARPLIGCRFDPSGRYLFVSAEDDTLQRYDLLTGEKTPFVGHKSWVRGLAFSPLRDNSLVRLATLPSAAVGSAAIAAREPAPFTVYSGDYHGNLFWWKGTAGAAGPVKSISAHEGWIRAVAVSPDGATVATCGNDHLVKLWNTADGKAVRTLDGHKCHVYNVAFHPDGTRLVSADLKGIIKDWDLATGKIVRDLDAKVLHKYDSGFAADIGGIRGIGFNARGTLLTCTGITNVSNAFAGVGNPLVVAFDWNAGTPKPLKPTEAFQGTGWGVSVLADGTVIAAGGGGQGRVWFWNASDGTNTHAVNVPMNARDMAVHPDGTAFALAGANGTCSIYTMMVGSAAPTPPIQPKKA